MSSGREPPDRVEPESWAALYTFVWGALWVLTLYGSGKYLQGRLGGESYAASPLAVAVTAAASGFYVGFFGFLWANLYARRALVRKRYELGVVEGRLARAERSLFFGRSFWTSAYLIGLGGMLICGAPALLAWPLSRWLPDWPRLPQVIFWWIIPGLLSLAVMFQSNLGAFVAFRRPRPAQPLHIPAARWLLLHNALPYAAASAGLGLLYGLAKYSGGGIIEASSLAWDLAPPYVLILLIVGGTIRFKTRVERAEGLVEITPPPPSIPRASWVILMLFNAALAAGLVLIFPSAWAGTPLATLLASKAIFSSVAASLTAVVSALRAALEADAGAPPGPFTPEGRAA